MTEKEFREFKEDVKERLVRLEGEVSYNRRAIAENGLRINENGRRIDEKPPRDTGRYASYGEGGCAHGSGCARHLDEVGGA